MARCSLRRTSELIATLRLIRTPKIGPVLFKKLIELYKDPETALSALCDGECREIRNICSLSEAEKELDFCDRIGARVISIFDRQYPQMLSNIPDPPPIITVLGNESLLDNAEMIAIVGSREASTSGYRLAYSFARELSQKKLLTISGLAKGIDSAVHSVIYDKVPTVAVLGNGINVIYPRENSKLYRSIAHDGGLLVSELPFSSLPKASLFPQRNRIISGMSRGVLVVEASKRSGALITANLAAAQGREVFAVPGSPLDSRCLGNNNLIKQGACLVLSAEDITRALGFASFPICRTSKEPHHEEKLVTKNQTKQAVTDYILKHLSSAPTSIDD
ncbi:MAG: DNA-processing protein DprA, partial [Aaplasma endosymbiont of Hyalomma asiaticum]